MTLFRLVLIFLGTLSLFVGVAGVFIPGLPTTPFLLLTAGLYIRSSEKLYHLLISNKQIGSYILEFRSNKGMTIRTKVLSLGIMWSMIFISCLFFISALHLRLIVSGLGITGTIVMGFIIPTIIKSNNSNQ